MTRTPDVHRTIAIARQVGSRYNTGRDTRLKKRLVPIAVINPQPFGRCRAGENPTDSLLNRLECQPIPSCCHGARSTTVSGVGRIPLSRSHPFYQFG